MTAIERPTIDFDHHSAEYRDNWQRLAADLHATGRPLAWTEHHGGSWVLADWDAVQRVATDWETFTSVNDLDGTENGGKGQIVPQMPYRLFLGESDPPLHTGRRRLEAPFFAPKGLRRLRPVAHRHLREAINTVIEQGSADLIDDILIPTTARTTLYVLGYDADKWEDAAAAAHRGASLPTTDPDYPHEEQARMREDFRRMLLARREAPADDIISALANGQVEGRQLSLDEGESMMNALVFGGFDTSVSLMANALLWLDDHPVEAARIREDEPFRVNAVEEFLRVHPPAHHIARTAVRDTELLGQPIRRGERILMWLAGANRDPAKFPEPDAVDLERENARDHVSFSSGGHRCLGSPLAKLEIYDVLTTLTTAIPDLTIDRSGVRVFPSIGLAAGFTRLPVTFTPRSPLPVDDVA
ncbi:cytochrome P450 [Modestobacter roseus]|uniref:Cytochrome P450 n=1 Tax=Modestobacter roseus TaxID=1181884 RepID=A0A562IVZ1_9ACTN|nr:cytochrome P450 [Modestobacter roseus]MQA34935.1 cytochrome P450 [Modestobacter roseus]TWH75179.1 cytochrome P450 [Modestobacter roseus]